MRNTVANKFLNSFINIPLDRVYIENEIENITYGTIQDLIVNFHEQYSCLKGMNCAIKADSRFELAKNIPLISSVAKNIFLQPRGLDEDVVEEFYNKASIDFVVEVTNSVLNILKVTDKPIELDPSDDSSQVWLLSTSGTTGTPKLVSYQLAALMNTSQENINKGADYKWGLCYDLNRFAGVQVYLQAIASGSTLTISESKDELKDLVNLFIEKRVNCLSATPSFWRKILMTENSDELLLKRITMGGEIADQTIINSLRKYFSDAKIIHIYASTEAGVGFSVKDDKEGFPYQYIGKFKLPTIELRIVNNILWLKSDRGAEKLVNGALEVDENGFINTGDIVEIDNERVLFKGRSSGTINVGGNKVTPEEIETVLNSYSGVVLSQVFGKKNSVLGMLVNAEVISKFTLSPDEKKQFKKDLISFCKGKLEPFKIPAMIKFVDNIEVNESGKIVRK